MKNVGDVGLESEASELLRVLERTLALTYVLRPRFTERSPRFWKTEVGGVVGILGE